MSGRKCQVCGAENGDAEFFCGNCGSEIAVALPKTSAGAATVGSHLPKPAKARVCPKCGQPNEPIFSLCTHCGFDLAAAAAEVGGNRTRLLLVIGQETFECKDGDVLGREGTVARPFFSAIATVSRRHVTLTQRDGRWFITVAPGVQNITQLDGQEIPHGAGQPLTREHVLKLSTQCEVRLKVAGL